LKSYCKRYKGNKKTEKNKRKEEEKKGKVEMDQSSPVWPNISGPTTLTEPVSLIFFPSLTGGPHASDASSSLTSPFFTGTDTHAPLSLPCSNRLT
jgi:hypothetical protein